MDRVEHPTGTPALVRPFRGREDYERMVDYFLGADEAFLRGMGVDPAKLPQREAWLESAMHDHERAGRERQCHYLAWIHGGVPVGHSSINKITIGEQGFMHLHLWVRDLRRSGLGTRYFEASAAEFMRALHLKRVYCEPYAGNPAPNRVLVKCGFRFVKEYRTVPGEINFEQDVNQYVLERPAAGAA
jgi:RimJ/RimL family protein N-acetyltransferase